MWLTGGACRFAAWVYVRSTGCSAVYAIIVYGPEGFAAPGAYSVVEVSRFLRVVE